MELNKNEKFQRQEEIEKMFVAYSFQTEHGVISWNILVLILTAMRI